MLKLSLMTVVVICLSFGSALSQQVEERIKLHGPRQIKQLANDNSTSSPLVALNYGDKAQASTDKPTRGRPSSGKIDVSSINKKDHAAEYWKQGSYTFPVSLTDLSLFNLKMPGDSGVLGLSSLGNGLGLVKTASLVERKRIDSLLMPGPFLKSLGSLPTVQDVRDEKLTEDEPSFWKRLEIEVSHSSHVFTLYSEGANGKRETLYECKIGLGAPEFPTPVGVYYVTHIYDQDPWWIPPPNRAWAAGDSPSQRVYGGTMAPLLKKKVVNVRKKDKEKDKLQEDFVENQVKLEDYGYRFHGTNQPRSIGRNQSHGCVRMLSDDAKKVSSLIKDHVGALERRESENGPFVVLKAPVKLNLVK